MTDRALGSYKTPRQSRERRDKRGPQQTLIVMTHAPPVFGQADIDQFTDVDVIADRLRAGHGEIVVLYTVAHIACDADALPNEKQPDGQHLHFKEWPPPPGHRAAMPRSPIHEEQNVAGFFLNDRLEGVDQVGGKESGTLRGLE